MDNYAREKTSAILCREKKKEKKKMKTKPARHFQVGYIHNQRSIKIYIYFFFCGYKNRPKPTTAFKIT